MIPYIFEIKKHSVSTAIDKNVYSIHRLDVKLPPSPVAAHWVSNVADAGHLPVELWHWAVLLDLLGKSALGSEGLVRRHSEKGPNRFFSMTLRGYFNRPDNQSIMKCMKGMIY